MLSSQRDTLCVLQGPFPAHGLQKRNLPAPDRLKVQVCHRFQQRHRICACALLGSFVNPSTEGQEETAWPLDSAQGHVAALAG